MSIQLKVFDSLVEAGERATLIIKDRSETDLEGEIIEINEHAVVMKYSSHGISYMTLVPMSSVAFIESRLRD